MLLKLTVDVVHRKLVFVKYFCFTMIICFTSFITLTVKCVKSVLTGIDRLRNAYQHSHDCSLHAHNRHREIRVFKKLKGTVSSVFSHTLKKQRSRLHDRKP